MISKSRTSFITFGSSDRNMCPFLNSISVTSEMTIHFLHTDAQQDDVRPVFKVKISFGDVSNKSVLMTGSENLKSPLGKVEMAATSLRPMPREEFMPVKLLLDCDSTLSCSLTLEEGTDQVFRQNIGQFDPMFQPNVFTLRYGLECLSNLKECN